MLWELYGDWRWPASIENIHVRERRAGEVVRVVPNAQLSAVKPQRRITPSVIGLHLLNMRFGAGLQLIPVQLIVLTDL